MGLLQKAVETYECFEAKAGEYYEGQEPLAPVSHVVTAAEIEIVLDSDGQYLSGRNVDKREPKIIIPVTEESSGRTSVPRPHPLCDTLAYIADYDEKKHALYVEQLEDWINYDSNQLKLKAILKYVKSGSVLKDLQHSQVIKLDKNGRPEKEKSIVRWRVENGLGESACWKDKELFKSFIRYYCHLRENFTTQFCMISGVNDIPAKQHLKGIIPVNGNAKLISANDSGGFTYRGRFKEDWQAATVSYEASQKAHNALRWIAANQGVRKALPGDGRTEAEDGKDNYSIYGGRTFLCWNPQGEQMPAIPLPFLGKTKKAPDLSNYKKMLNSVLSGYKANLSVNAKTVIVSFDAATTGRLAVTYYNEMLSSDFLERLRYWDETCCWSNGSYGIQSPLLYNIVKLAYGTQRDGAIVPPSDELLKLQMQRLVLCRLNKTPIPRDVMMNLVQKACNLLIYDDKTRFQLLFTACAVIRKYYNDVYKEEIDVKLNESEDRPSFLFGRLLAVLEKMEKDTYDKENMRETNAMRYEREFVQRPLKTLETLKLKLKPYENRLEKNRPASYYFYRKLYVEIMDKLSTTDFDMNSGLDETYLLGYSKQWAYFYSNKTENANSGEQSKGEEK